MNTVGNIDTRNCLIASALCIHAIYFQLETNTHKKRRKSKEHNLVLAEGI